MVHQYGIANMKRTTLLPLTDWYIAVVCALNKLAINPVPTRWKRIVTNRPVFHILCTAAQKWTTYTLQRPWELLRYL